MRWDLVTLDGVLLVDGTRVSAKGGCRSYGAGRGSMRGWWVANWPWVLTESECVRVACG